MFRRIFVLVLAAAIPLLMWGCGSNLDSAGDSPVSTPEAVKAAATFVGSTKCTSCHGDKENWGHTLHKFSLRKPLVFSKYQEKGVTFWGDTLNKGIKLSLGTDATGGLDEDNTPDDGEIVVFYYDSVAKKWQSHYQLGLGGTAVADLPATSGAYAKKYSAQVVPSGTGYAVELINLAGTGTLTYPITLTYGGEANYKQRYVLSVGASKYISPLQYNDKWETSAAALANKWVEYNASHWHNGNTTLAAPSKNKAFDANCAGCHFTGYTIAKNSVGEEMADAVDDPNGEVDFDGDGTLDEVNIGCEACHGAGSAHVATLNPAYIVNPANLPLDRANMVCGQCHNRGDTLAIYDFSTVTNRARLEFPAKLDAAGNLKKFRPGDNIAEYYVWDSGTGAYNSNFWGGEPSSGNYVGSQKHHQQFIDILQGPHNPDKPNDETTCFSCHTLHDNVSPAHKQIVTSIIEDGIKIPTDNNNDSLCLACHAGQGPFATLTKEEIAAIKGNYSFNEEMAAVKTAVTAHTQHYFDPVDQDGGGGASRCSICHLPKTAKTALNNDISSHVFTTIQPSKSLSTAPSAGVRNSCNGCHATASDADLNALQAAYDAKFAAIKTNLYFDQWAASGHANYAGEPFNYWNASGAVPATCAKCHSKDGFVDFVADGTVVATAKLGTTLSCGTCHINGDTPALYTDASTRWDDLVNNPALEDVVFPSALTADLGDASNICMACHQGRSSTPTVNTRIADGNLAFSNIHYFAAAATLFGTDVQGGYEYGADSFIGTQTYRGQNTFAAHPATLTTCTGCHLREGALNHTFVPDVTRCSTVSCHTAATTFNALGGSPGANYADITALKTQLLGVIKASGVTQETGYPYFSNITTAAQLKACYNWQVADKEPCGYIHNGIYIKQLLYDSIVDLSAGAVTPVVVRP